MKAPYLPGLALAIATGFALPLAGSAEAAMGGALPSTQILPIEKAQFFFLGQNYCWYDGGWQGPGLYWCGYAWNNGQGWGGGEGWQGGATARTRRRLESSRPASKSGGALPVTPISASAHGGFKHGTPVMRQGRQQQENINSARVSPSFTRRPFRVRAARSGIDKRKPVAMPQLARCGARECA